MWDIQLFKLNFDSQEIKAISDVVAGGWLAGVVGDEEVVAEEDDGGEEVADTVLVVVTLHQLAHAHTLQHR